MEDDLSTSSSFDQASDDGDSKKDDSSVRINFPSLKIWVFWDDPKSLPPLVRACVSSWRKQNPGHTVILLTDENVEEWVKEWPEGHGPDGSGFESIQKKSNWIRLTLLEVYGGVWVDASSWCTGPIESWVTR